MAEPHTTQSVVRATGEESRRSPFFFRSGGRLLFGPWGPYRVYVVPREAFRSPIERALTRLTRSAFAIDAVVTLIACAILRSLTLPLLLGLLLALLQLVLYCIVVRRIIRRLTPLPVSLSIRCAAASMGEEDFGKLMLALLAISIMLGVTIIVGIAGAWFAVLPMTAVWIVVLHVLYVRRSERRAGPESADFTQSVALDGHLQRLQAV